MRNAPIAIIVLHAGDARAARGRRRGSRRPDRSRGSPAPRSCPRPRPRGSPARRVPSRPGSCPPHASANHSRPASSVTRPGRKPGTSPASIAPCTLPRRSAERKRTSGTSRSAAAARIATAADSASDGRPSTTTTGPGRSPRAPAICVERVGAELLARHGARTTAVACSDNPCATAREVDERHAELHRGAAHAQVEHRELLLEVGPEQHDRGGAVAVGDLGARQAEHELGREAVAELRVDVVGADHALHQAGERVRVFVGAARAAEQRDRLGTVLRRARRGSTPAAASSASGHDTSRSSPSTRAMRLEHAVARSGSTRCRSGPCRTASRG